MLPADSAVWTDKKHFIMSPLDQIKQNTDSIIGEEALEEKLQSGKPLRIKLGVDPTRPDLTFGHMVVFNKLRQFQDLGHEAILIIGDYTTRVGDPSERSETRPVLSEEEIEENSRTYLDQAFQVMDPEKTTVHRNSEWFGAMDFMGCLRLARQMTVARMLERDDFAKRYQANSPISIIEFLYPLLQGHDSVQIRADVELGGSDQLFNLLVGRQLQRDAGQSEQVCITLPLLIGLDGSKKMSKSADNYIAFNDSAKDMFGKIMSISDETMWDYYQLLLLKPEDEIEAIRQDHPMDSKKALALSLVTRFHGSEAAQRELQQFEQVFSKNKLPDAMPEFPWKALTREGSESLVNLAAATEIFGSKGEIRRLIAQGAFKVDQQKVEDPNATLEPPQGEPVVVQAGKRKFFKILP